MKARALGVTILAAAALAACGGGDSSVGALNSYVGTWKGPCTLSEVKNSSGASMREQYTSVYSADGDNLKSVVTTRIYQPSDATCSGNIAATHTYTESITFKSTATVSISGTSISGHYVGLSWGAIGGTAPNNGLVYPSDYFTETGSNINMYLGIKDNKMYGSDTTTLDQNLFSTKVQ